MSGCYTMNTDLINITQNITFNQVITLSLGSMHSFPLQWNSIWGSKDFSQQNYWGTHVPAGVKRKRNVKGSDSSAHLWNEAFSWINKSISILFFPLSRNLSNYFWRVTSIISFIFPRLSRRRVPHSLVRVCGEMWDRTLNKPIFCTIDPTIVLFLCLYPPPGSPLSYENVIDGNMVLNY